MHCFLNVNGAHPDATVSYLTRLLCAFAGSGVDIFFVLSGFLVCMIARRDERRGPSSAWRFVVRRGARIFPLFWLTLGGFCAFVLLRGWSLQSLSAPEWFRVATLTTRDIPYQDPAWTLAYEVWFYFGIMVILFLPYRWLDTAIVVWLLAQVIGYVLAPETTTFSATYMLKQTLIIEFFLGCAVEKVVHEFRNPSQKIVFVCAAVAVGLFLVGCVLNYLLFPTGHTLTRWERPLYYGVSSALFVYVGVNLDLSGRAKIPEWLRSLGDCSYSIYLWHYPVMGIIFLTSPSFYVGASPLAKALINLVLTLAIAPVSYRLIERPSINFARRMTGYRDSKSKDAALLKI